MSVNRNRHALARFIDNLSFVSSAKAARIETCDYTGECPFCFPHGIETRSFSLRKVPKSNWGHVKMSDIRRATKADRNQDHRAPALRDIITVPASDTGTPDIPDDDRRWLILNPEYDNADNTPGTISYQESPNTVRVKSVRIA